MGEGRVRHETAQPSLNVALKWTRVAHSDLLRLYEFLVPVNPAAAARTVRHLAAGAKRIPAHPRLGVQMPEFAPREVRKVLLGDYEIRYELTDTDVFILRIFHTREDR
ncbi:MAG TPA: type II toxin-antitoxin system RelE/ParE family toxin [Burkholderiales bacterium]